jgi:hypothetical protein
VSDLPYALEDPRPNAIEAPYTYFLPSDAELAAVLPGDMVQLVFRSLAPDPEWDAERMWVTIDAADGALLHGRLETQPDDIPGVSPGDPVEFERHHIIDCIWDQGRTEPPPARPAQRSYWERCLVDRCVIEEGVPVHFLYREEPQPAAEDSYPDSGWVIRGDYRDLGDAELETREMAFVALGLVLNHDYSWLHLIDEPIGSAFIRDWETGRFVPEQ